MSTPVAPPAPPARIDLIDALRGSALLGLFLLHAVEHFDFSLYPENPPEWLAGLNTITKDVAFFLFAGKAYAIFAMMFGLSFSLILDGAARRGVDFRGRFLWRLCVLAAMGYVFGLLYCGEILSMLAVLGTSLVFLHRVPAKWLIALSVALLLQLPFLWQLLRTVSDASYVPARLDVGGYYRQMYPIFANEGFWEVCKVNAWTGLLARSSWSIENGRYLQMLGLFIWGLLIGRARLFENRDALLRVARWALIVGGVSFAVLYFARTSLPSWDVSKTQRSILRKLITSELNLSQMMIWAAGFVLLYQLAPVQKCLRWLVPFGRTSLTSYVVQNAVGVVLFYHFGAGLFREWGQFYSILYGVVFAVVQSIAMHVWLNHFHHGPLEWLWRCLTQFSFQTPLRRTPGARIAPTLATAAASDPLNR